MRYSSEGKKKSALASALGFLFFPYLASIVPAWGRLSANAEARGLALALTAPPEAEGTTLGPSCRAACEPLARAP